MTSMIDLNHYWNPQGAGVIALALLTHAYSQFRELGVQSFMASILLGSIALAYYNSNHLDQEQTLKVTQSLQIYFSALLASIITYRLGYHRLTKFPGPFYLAITKWAWVIPDLLGQRPYILQRLHSKYGPIVRIGPRELSVSDPNALSAIYGGTGTASRCMRGPWYANTVESTTHKSLTLLNTPKMTHHSALRKVWDPAFSSKALKGYEDVIRDYANLTLTAVNESKEGTIDWGKYCFWYGFDVMGALGWGIDFEMVKSQKTSHVIAIVEKFMAMVQASGNIPYMLHPMTRLPNPIAAFETWVDTTLQKRMDNGPSGIVEADVFGHLLGEMKAQKTERNFQELSADGRLLVIAGSDTSSNVMAMLIFELVAQPLLYKQLQAEIDQVFSANEKADDFNLLRDHCDFLNNCITETLRLWPPVMSGLQRNTPFNESLVLPSGHVVPQNTVVSTATFVFQRSAENYENPNEFHPDRWSKGSKYHPHNAKAYSPFGYGPTGCIGKQVALMEIRVMTARFVQDFNATFSSNFNIGKFRKSVMDHFVMVKDPIQLKVSKRED